MPAFDLHGQAGVFAGDLTDLLNASLCKGVRLKAVVSEPGRAVVGYKISKRSQLATEGIAVTRGKKPSCYLGLSYRLQADDEGTYLTVTSSFIGLFADRDLDQALLHYDYERGKGDGYPEAHLQVTAESAAWKALCAKKDGRALEKLHLPVGGRRYRPTLEDVVEFLGSEGLADMKAGWQERVEESREAFQRRQLRAAVRRDPEAAVALLRDIGRIDSSGQLVDPPARESTPSAKLKAAVKAASRGPK